MSQNADYRRRPTRTVHFDLEVSLEVDADPQEVAEGLECLLMEGPWSDERDVPGLFSFDGLTVSRTQ